MRRAPGCGSGTCRRAPRRMFWASTLLPSRPRPDDWQAASASARQRPANFRPLRPGFRPASVSRPLFAATGLLVVAAPIIAPSIIQLPFRYYRCGLVRPCCTTAHHRHPIPGSRLSNPARFPYVSSFLSVLCNYCQRFVNDELPFRFTSRVHIKIVALMKVQPATGTGCPIRS